MRIGCARVRIGGIAGVGTRQEHRLKGYSSRVMHESTALMADHKCDIGFLYGIPDFYHRFGYGVGFADSKLYVGTGNLLRAGAIHPTQAMRKADGPAVARLYNRLNDLRTGTAVRPGGWRYFDISASFNKPGKAVLVLNRSGRITGYATYSVRDERFIVSEVGGTGNAVFETLAAVLGRRARRAGVERVQFHLPVDDPFGAFCARYGSRLEVEAPRNAGPMGRIIHLTQLMERLAPEFNRRLEASGFSWKGSLAFQTDLGSVGLKGNSASVAVTPGRSALKVELPQMALTQLALGYRSVDDVVYDAGVKIPSRALPVLEALFPKQDAYMWWSDRF